MDFHSFLTGLHNLTRWLVVLAGLLAAAAGMPVRREMLIAKLVENVHDFDPHRLEMLVHRLRRKTLSALACLWKTLRITPSLCYPPKGWLPAGMQVQSAQRAIRPRR